MAIKLSLAIKHASIINEVLTAIRDAASSIEKLGRAEFTPEQLAGQYAFHALDDCGSAVTPAGIEAHLNYLLAEGVEGVDFDFAAAVEHALAIAADA